MVRRAPSTQLTDEGVWGEYQLHTRTARKGRVSVRAPSSILHHAVHCAAVHHLSHGRREPTGLALSAHADFNKNLRAFSPPHPSVHDATTTVRNGLTKDYSHVHLAAV